MKHLQKWIKNLKSCLTTINKRDTSMRKHMHSLFACTIIFGINFLGVAADSDPVATAQVKSEVRAQLKKDRNDIFWKNVASNVLSVPGYAYQVYPILKYAYLLPGKKNFLEVPSHYRPDMVSINAAMAQSSFLLTLISDTTSIWTDSTLKKATTRFFAALISGSAYAHSNKTIPLYVAGFFLGDYAAEALTDYTTRKSKEYESYIQKAIEEEFEKAQNKQKRQLFIDKTKDKIFCNAEENRQLIKTSLTCMDIAFFLELNRNRIVNLNIDPDSLSKEELLASSKLSYEKIIIERLKKFNYLFGDEFKSEKLLMCEDFVQGLDKELEKKFKAFIKKNRLFSKIKDKTCSICCDNMEINQELLKLPCKRHYLHVACNKQYQKEFVKGKSNIDEFSCPFKCLSKGQF